MRGLKCYWDHGSYISNVRLDVHLDSKLITYLVFLGLGSQPASERYEEKECSQPGQWGSTQVPPQQVYHNCKVITHHLHMLHAYPAIRYSSLLTIRIWIIQHAGKCGHNSDTPSKLTLHCVPHPPNIFGKLLYCWFKNMSLILTVYIHFIQWYVMV